MPLVGLERRWGPLALLGNSATAAVATWCFIIGGYVSRYLPAGTGSVVVVAGMLLGMFLVVLACVPISTRYGVEATRSTVPLLGVRGSQVTVVLVVAFTVGWSAILMVFLGRGVGVLLVELNVVAPSSERLTATVAAVAGCGVSWVILRGGTGALRRVGPVIAVSAVALSLAVLVILVARIGVSNLLDARPTAGTGDRRVDYMTGIELMVATALSWWPYVGGIVRQGPRSRSAIWPVIVGLGLVVCWLSMIGLYAGLGVPGSNGDPTRFLVESGGVWIGLAIVGFTVVANIGSSTLGIFISALALKQVQAIDRRITWNQATGLTVAMVALLVLVMDGPLINDFGTFLALSGVVFGPLCGAQIADYFVCRRQELDIRGLYSSVPGSTYWFMHGYNPRGFVALAAGSGVYVLLFNPLSFDSAPAFGVLTASLPSAAVAGLVHILLTRTSRTRRLRSAPPRGAPKSGDERRRARSAR